MALAASWAAAVVAAVAAVVAVQANHPPAAVEPVQASRDQMCQIQR